MTRLFEDQNNAPCRYSQSEALFVFLFDANAQMKRSESMK